MKYRKAIFSESFTRDNIVESDTTRPLRKYWPDQWRSQESGGWYGPLRARKKSKILVARLVQMPYMTDNYVSFELILIYKNIS